MPPCIVVILLKKSSSMPKTTTWRGAGLWQLIHDMSSIRWMKLTLKKKGRCSFGEVLGMEEGWGIETNEQHLS
jgi:hypothetical protein